MFQQEIARSFSTYCAISIMHSLMYKKVVDAQHRSKLSNELMMYHMKVSWERELTKLRHACGIRTSYFSLLSPLSSLPVSLLLPLSSRALRNPLKRAEIVADREV